MSAQSRALARLVEQFDAEVLVNLRPLPTMRPSERAVARNIADEHVESCTGCSLHSTCTTKDSKGSVFPGGMSSDLIVLRAHPTPSEDRYGRLLSAALQHDMVNHPAFVHVNACVPRHLNGTLRHATDTERKACEANLMLAMRATHCPSVLIVGKEAMKAWRPDLTVSQVAGIVGTWHNQWMVTVVEHPSTAKHKQEQLEWVRNTKRAIDTLLGATVGGIGGRCLHPKCSEPVFVYDPNALPWCEKHIEIKKEKRPRDFVDISMFAEEAAS